MATKPARGGAALNFDEISMTTNYPAWYRHIEGQRAASEGCMQRHVGPSGRVLLSGVSRRRAHCQPSPCRRIGR